MSIFE